MSQGGGTDLAWTRDGSLIVLGASGEDMHGCAGTQKSLEMVRLDTSWACVDQVPVAAPTYDCGEIQDAMDALGDGVVVGGECVRAFDEDLGLRWENCDVRGEVVASGSDGTVVVGGSGHITIVDGDGDTRLPLDNGGYCVRDVKAHATGVGWIGWAPDGEAGEKRFGVLRFDDLRDG